jgi:hypothetical protein
MAIDPIGQDSYKGLAVPLFGESAIYQENSSNAIVTLMHSSLNTGRYLMCMDYSSYFDDQTPSSDLTDLVVFDIDADGGFRCVSGTTVLAEMNSSGLYGGTTQIISASGKLQTERKQLSSVVVTSATTGIDVTTSDSGKLYYLTTALTGATTCQIRLPATPFLGMYIDVYARTTAVGDITVVSTVAGAGFKFLASSAAFVTTKAVSCATTGPWYARFTCVDSTNGYWSAQALYYEDRSSNVYGVMTSASATS